MFTQTKLFKVSYAQNGYEAFQIIYKQKMKQKYFDVVMLDFDMVIMNGVQTGQKIHDLFFQEKVFSHSRIIAIDQKKPENIELTFE